MDRNIAERAKQILARAKQEPTKTPSEEPTANRDTVIEPASPMAREVYWEQMDSRIIGGVKPIFLAMVGTGAAATFWIVVEYQGQPRWIRSERLRSRRAFQEQEQVREVQIIRSL